VPPSSEFCGTIGASKHKTVNNYKLCSGRPVQYHC